MDIFPAKNLDEGLSVALAVLLFNEEQISLGKAAHLAGMRRAEFAEYLAQWQIPVIRISSTSELRNDLAAFGE